MTFENHVSFEGDEAACRRNTSLVLFENHVSFEGDEARLDGTAGNSLFENHVSFEGDEAGCTVVFSWLSLRTM